MARENQRARRLKSFAVTLQRLAAAPQVGSRRTSPLLATSSNALEPLFLDSTGTVRHGEHQG
jgi:hypothetical protein